MERRFRAEPLTEANMNIQHAEILLRQLERLPDEKFVMGDWIDHRGPCGTVACVAGWAALLNGGPTDGTIDTEFWARDWLGLGHSDARRLFYGRDLMKPL